MLIVIGARDFSPEITVHLIGTEVPCFEIVTRKLSILLNSQLRQRHKKAPEIALRGSFVIRCGGSGRTRIFYFVIRNSYFVPVIAQFHQKLMR